MYICMYPADIPGNVAQVKRTKRDRAQRYNQDAGGLLGLRAALPATPTCDHGLGVPVLPRPAAG